MQHLDIGQTAETASTVVDLREDRRILVGADIYQRPLSRYERFLKPTIDAIGAFVLLVAFSPIMLISAIAVAVSLGTPIIIRQQRVGRGGRVFTLYKFRTMHPDRRTTDTSYVGPDRRISHKREDDPRLTPVGRFLRKWSLDELPQFVNVLKGEMSLVGPRPEMVEIVTGYDLWQHRRHAVKPGITGLWQISERGDRMLHEATELDIEYIDTLTPTRDLSILVQTPIVMLGARRGH